VSPGSTPYEFYSTSCETNKVWLFDRKNRTKEFLAGPVTNYIASGNGTLYVVGKEDKKLYRYSRESKEWDYMGLEKVKKVAAGPNNSVYAIT
jgi:hypothetical protein